MDPRASVPALAAEERALDEELAHRAETRRLLSGVEVRGLFSGLCELVDAQSTAAVLHGLTPEHVVIGAGTHAVLRLRGLGPHGLIPIHRSGYLCYYASPEELSGAPLDTRTTVYDLGLLLFELLTLRRALSGDDARELRWVSRAGAPELGDEECRRVRERILKVGRPRPSALREELPGAIDRVIASALALDPLERIPTVRELDRLADGAVREWLSQSS